MRPLTEKAIRESFVNASRKEVSDLTLPEGFGDIDWDGRPDVAVVVPDGDEAVIDVFLNHGGTFRER